MGLSPILTPVVCCDSKVMVVLLEEDQAERKSLRKLRTETDTLSFSDGSLQLNTKLPFLYGTHYNRKKIKFSLTLIIVQTTVFLLVFVPCGFI